MRKLVVDFSEADDIIRKSKNALEKLYDEGENVEGAIRELSSLGGSYGEENWILNQLHEEKREIEDECNRLEKFCQKYRSFVDKVEETDERLSKKFETDIENYCKKENIEIESDLDKFLDKVGTALDVVGMIPGIGDVADAINGVLCLARGDFWGAALSFVAVIPLIGDSFKLLKYTDEAAELLKYGDEVVNIGKGILKEGTEKASKAFKKSLENLMESGGVKKFKNALSATLDTGREFIIRGKEGVDTALTKLGMPQVFNTLCTDGCFLGDTEIETENGLRNIKYIQIGEKVLTYNEETGKIEYKEVVDKLERSTRNVCIIKTSNDTISSTTGHLFMVKNRWWVSSSSINVGDEIQTSNGTYEEVISKEIKLEGAINVTYNISLSENHTFFVGQDSILTHNTITKRECEKNLKKVLEGVGNPYGLTLKDIPSVRNGEFNKFFNSLTSEELDTIWKDPKLRQTIEDRLRQPGGLHEWHLVSRTPQFKNWDVTAEQIKDLRSLTTDVKFINPKGVHGGRGSTTAHNELLKIIDSATDYDTFIRGLNNWANYRLDGGINSLPKGLQLK